uniref:(northern house mosquito) hypothetical protein n=1 Tax=Culex pipiens TaxID=7175 RepID=A0A8D8J0C8_CULPI
MASSPSSATRCFLVLLTAASQIPPMCGAEGGLKVHLMPRLDKNRAASLPLDWICSTNSCRTRSAPTKLVPLSDQISTGYPRRDTNRLRTLMKVFVDKSLATSRCTALVERHTNTAMYPLVTLTPRTQAALSLTGPA